MSRRSNGLLAVWAEAQRQQQRQREAQRRAELERQRAMERQQRAAERELARHHREQQAAYRQRREADARQRTEELEARVVALNGLLVAGLQAPGFRTAMLTRPEQIDAFDPGHLGVPVPMPDPDGHRQRSGGWGLGGGRRAGFERELQAARAAEAQRQQQLAAYQQQYHQWAQGELAAIRQHNAGIAAMAEALRSGTAEEVVEYFSAALYASSGWPEGLPRQVSAAYDATTRQLVLNWQLPGYGVVPEAKSVRFVSSTDQDKETARPVTQRRAIYRDVVAQCMLLVLRDLFAADEFGIVDSVALNGFVDDHDPATGQRTQIFLATVAVTRSAFAGLDLAQVDAVECLVTGLRGQLAARPDQRTAIPPGRLPEAVGDGVVSHGVDDEPDLLEMDPIAFEGLIAELFRARGMDAVTTQRSNDGGVDVEALDPDPLSGGKIIVQVKRYRNTVPPSAVRDLYGTVQGAGANKGVLVTTSSFGPGSHTFANGKPLTLVSGEELIGLLRSHGLRGRLGSAPGPDRGSAPPPPNARPPAAAHVLGLSWDGAVALDACALVTRGQRVLSEDHFVFFNNPRTPDGTVRMVSSRGVDRASIQVIFDALPERADRLVLIAAVDPEVNPDADLSGFRNASIRLLDDSGTELDTLEVSDGRPGETALVLGSFRRRPGGDWAFVTGGNGYPGGLEALIGDYGIEIA